MKKRLLNTFTAVCLASFMLSGMTVTASAQQYTDKEIEAMKRLVNGLNATYNSEANRQTAPAEPPPFLTADELKAHTDTMFELVNKEREKAGLAPLVRDSLLDGAAMIRAAEIRAVDLAGGVPHTRPDGTSWRTVLDGTGINGRRCGENISRAKSSPQISVDLLMQSDGHRKNILRDNYGSIGIGIYQRSDGSLDWIQIFMLK